MNKTKVYSYLRFSDSRQSTGTSIERQTQYALNWALKHGLTLDNTLSLRDEGLSAYHQKHIKQGALGTFLEAIRDDRIAEGSVLIVEGLDRLSRAEPILAQGQLALIINAGITVVTASDNKEYNRESLRSNPMDLVYSLLVMIRAHEESATKSKRVKEALKIRIKGWLDGTYRGRIVAGGTPQWLTWTNNHWTIIEERAQAYKIAIQLYRQGRNSQSIIDHLKTLGLSMNSNGLPKAAHLPTTLKNPALIGSKKLCIDGERYELRNYYPALISDSEHRAMLSYRRKIKKKGEIISVVSGIAMLRCGYCNSAVVGGNHLRRKRGPNGILLNGHRRLHCRGYSRPKQDRKCPVQSSCSSALVEIAIIDYCSQPKNWRSLTNNIHSHTQDQLQVDQHPIENQASTELNATLIELKECAKALDHRVEISNQENSTTLTAHDWSNILNGIKALDTETRKLAQQLIKQAFQKIIIYMNGFTHSKANGQHKTLPPIDLILIPKYGKPRSLHINRRTGKWTTSNSNAMNSAPDHWPAA